MLEPTPPRGQEAIGRFLLEELPALGPPPRGEEGLARARRFYALAGNPQNRAKQIHIVGTAGKGTTAGAILSRLVGAGATAAAHLSPHVYDLRERFLLNGRMPPWEAVDDALAALWPAMLEMVETEGRPPSFFEVTTAISWVIGVHASVRYHVTEAGIGGTYDSTNTIDQADKITVVTPIGYDHLDTLGHDIASIARNKADVIRPGCPVVMGPQPHEAAADVVRTVAARSKATLVEAGDLSDSFGDQAAAIAQAVMDLLAARDGLDPTAGPAPVHLPGRAETLDVGGIAVVLDGAHNPLKIRGLRASLDRRPSVAVVALSHEKDLDACADELGRLADIIITCQFAVTAGGRVVRHSWPSPELADAIRKAAPLVEVIESTDVQTAVAEAMAMTKPGQSIVATGSFMMIEPAREAATLTER